MEERVRIQDDNKIVVIRKKEKESVLNRCLPEILKKNYAMLRVRSEEKKKEYLSSPNKFKTIRVIKKE